ncbi:MAG: class I SAM-dependent methyltransferase [Acidobacteriota bacterium]|nr:class I SAM-dependent methyltransferase [Acidobacteriota bacterium]
MVILAPSAGYCLFGEEGTLDVAAGDIAARIEALDLSLFDATPSQSSDGDRRAWLAVQRSLRRQDEYVYLEIGSHLGGSIQQHLADPRCRTIVSIDKRPLSQPDDRGEAFFYEGNSTAQMLDHLRRVSPYRLDKLACFDTDASEFDVGSLPAAPDYCFIDGEHTYAAVLSDFAFCLRVCAPNAAICFHDDAIIYLALREIMSDLRRRGIPYTAHKLTGSTFGIFLRECPAIRDPYVSTRSQDAGWWLLRRRFRSLLPAPLVPIARWAVGAVAHGRRPN